MGIEDQSRTKPTSDEIRFIAEKHKTKPIMVRMLVGKVNPDHIDPMLRIRANLPGVSLGTLLAVYRDSGGNMSAVEEVAENMRHVAHEDLISLGQ